MQNWLCETLCLLSCPTVPVSSTQDLDQDFSFAEHLLYYVISVKSVNYLIFYIIKLMNFNMQEKRIQEKTSNSDLSDPFRSSFPIMVEPVNPVPS